MIEVGTMVKHAQTGRVIGTCTRLHDNGGIRISCFGGGDSIYRPHELAEATTDDSVALW